MTPALTGQTMTTAFSSTPCETLDRDELLARCLGNSQLAMRVVDTFRARLAQDLSAVDQALQDGDWDLLADLAHRIKGAAASVSAPQVRRWAAELEQATRARRMAELPPGVARLRGEADRLIRTLSALELDTCDASGGLNPLGERRW